MGHSFCSFLVLPVRPVLFADFLPSFRSGPTRSARSSRPSGAVKNSPRPTRGHQHVASFHERPCRSNLCCFGIVSKQHILPRHKLLRRLWACCEPALNRRVSAAELSTLTLRDTSTSAKAEFHVATAKSLGDQRYGPLPPMTPLACARFPKSTQTVSP